MSDDLETKLTKMGRAIQPVVGQNRPDLSPDVRPSVHARKRLCDAAFLPVAVLLVGTLLPPVAKAGGWGNCANDPEGEACTWCTMLCDDDYYNCMSTYNQSYCNGVSDACMIYQCQAS